MFTLKCLFYVLTLKDKSSIPVLDSSEQMKDWFIDILNKKLPVLKTYLCQNF